MIAVNSYVKALEGIEPSSHGERRILREMGGEGLRALYSDLMKTLHEEALYEGVYQPVEVEYAIRKVGSIVEQLEAEAGREARGGES